MKLPELTDREIRLWIIQKLLRHHVLCKYHIVEDNLPKGKEAYRDQIMKVLDEMVRNGEIVRFPHKGGYQICLNKERKGEFEEEIKHFELF
jgi:hypothetical protein